MRVCRILQGWNCWRKRTARIQTAITSLSWPIQRSATSRPRQDPPLALAPSSWLCECPQELFLVGVGWGWGNVFIQALYLHASSALRLGKWALPVQQACYWNISCSNSRYVVMLKIKNTQPQEHLIIIIARKISIAHQLPWACCPSQVTYHLMQKQTCNKSEKQEKHI